MAVAGVTAALGTVTMATAIPAPIASMTADPGALDLGTVVIGSSSAASTVIGTSNNGAFDWVGVELATPPGVISGADAAEFTIDPTPTGACTAAQRLFQANTCTTRVVFTPASAGAKTASLTVSGSASYVVSTPSVNPCTAPAAGGTRIATNIVPTCAITIPLTATALAPPAGVVGITPSPATVRTGQTLKVVVVTTNSGGATIEAATTVLTVPRTFRVVNGAGGTRTGTGLSWTDATIAGGVSVRRTVTLRALSATARTADLTTSLTATGVTAAAQAKVKVTVPARRKPVVPVTG